MSSIQSAYSDWSATYDTDRNLTRDLDAAVTREILGGRHYPSALELGCGTGKNTPFLLSIADDVHALDFSEGMLAQARAKTLGDRVTFAQADLTKPWPVPERSAYLITSNLVLEHVEDLNPIFAQAARTLRPGGSLFISELHPFKQYQGSKARYERDGQRILVASFTHHISDYLTAASLAGLRLVSLRESWHPDDQEAPPRLASFLFTH